MRGYYSDTFVLPLPERHGTSDEPYLEHLSHSLGMVLAIQPAISEAR